MLNNELATAENTEVNAQGLIGEILALETEADTLKAQAKEILAKADEKRAIVEQSMQAMGMKSLRHESGYTATMTKGQTKVAFPDQELLLAKLKENKLTNFVEKVPKQVIPEHEQVRQDTFATWLKGVTAKDLQTMFGDAVTVEQKPDHLTITKPKA